MLPITIWMNMPSCYQDEMFEALRDSGRVDLRVVFARKTALDRLELGWKEGKRDYRHRFLSRKFAPWDALRIAWFERDRLHIVNGIGAEPAFALALFALALARSRFVVYAEAFDPRKRTDGMRALLRDSFGGWIAKRALGMLAISHFAEKVYTQMGFNSDRVFPFGYFRSNNNWRPTAARLAGDRRREVIFVGQLIHRKGVDLLLEAMRPLFGQYPDLFLSLVGGGSEAEALLERARSMGIADRVNFEGSASSDMIQSRLALADVLVLPSRWDGWGIVVNEALSAGLPVIVSDRCGAADLVRHGVNGYVFRTEDIGDLRRYLSGFLDSADGRFAMRSAAAGSGRVISAEAAALYLIKCVEHMTGESDSRPSPPWLVAQASDSARH